MPYNQRMAKARKAAKKFAVSIVGFPLLAFGLVLIPLPGPGLLLCFLSLFILSLEFEWASKHVERAKAQLHKIYQEAKARGDRIREKAETKD